MFIHNIVALFEYIPQFTNTAQANPPVIDLTSKTCDTCQWQVVRAASILLYQDCEYLWVVSQNEYLQDSLLTSGGYFAHKQHRANVKVTGFC